MRESRTPEIIRKHVYPILRRARSTLFPFCSKTVELTTQCNSACKYCARRYMVKSGELKIESIGLDLLEKICLDSRGIPGNFVLAGLGEPLMYDKLLSAISLVKEILPREHLTVITNGILLDGNLSEMLIHSGINQVNLSINSFNRDTYWFLNGVDAFNQVMQNVTLFLETKRHASRTGALRRTPRALIQLLEIDANRLEKQSFIEHFKPLMEPHDRFNFQVFENAGGRIAAGEYDETAKHLPQRRPCAQLWRQASITASGDVYPCCIAQIGGTQLKLGNVKESSLSDLLKGEKLRKLKEKHLLGQYGDLPVCRGCDMWRKPADIFVRLGGRWW